MESRRSLLSRNFANTDSPLHKTLLVCAVAILSYLAARLGGLLILHPQLIWPLWPGCVLLVSLLLLQPRTLWPALIVASFAAFAVYDLQTAVPIRSIAFFMLADVVEVLTAALCLSYFFDGLPRLDSVKALVKYSFIAMFLAPFAGAFVGALAMSGNYWTSWRIGFFSEAIGFLTLTPVVLSWARVARLWANSPRTYYLEAATLVAALILSGYFTFVAPGSSRDSPALLYSLVPFLLWSALRFGSLGLSTSVLVIAVLSIWGAIHGLGPFSGSEPIKNVLSLQLFLFCTAIPFMVLAALAEERKRTVGALRESEARLRLAVQAGRMYAFEWDATTDVIVRSGECAAILDWMDEPTLDTRRQFVNSVHPDDRETYFTAEHTLTPENSFYQTSYRVLRPDGTAIWLEARGHGIFDDKGKTLRIMGMVADVTERRSAEEAMRESEKRFRLVANTAPVLIWMAGPDKLCTFFNKGWLDFTGRLMEQELGNGWASSVHPDDLERCLKSYSEAFDARVDFEFEYSLRRFDGEYRWIVAYGVPRFDSNGGFCGYIGSCVDITERKLSEAWLQELSGRLIHAQEQERSRIARELHDDLSQRMALLQINLEQFKQGAAGLSTKARQQLQQIAEVATEISSNLHDLSHRLHPSKLDTLGLVSALEGVCREFSEQHGLQVKFVYQGVPANIPKDVTLCLFRIVQEALQNVLKHSGALSAEVALSGQSDGLELCISDIGTGFSREAAQGKGGLGLISMHERMRLVGGELHVESEPMHGTRIRVRVPLHSFGAQVPSERKAYKSGA